MKTLFLEILKFLFLLTIAALTHWPAQIHRSARLLLEEKRLSLKQLLEA